MRVWSASMPMTVIYSVLSKKYFDETFEKTDIRLFLLRCDVHIWRRPWVTWQFQHGRYWPLEIYWIGEQSTPMTLKLRHVDVVSTWRDDHQSSLGVDYFTFMLYDCFIQYIRIINNVLNCKSVDCAADRWSTILKVHRHYHKKHMRT